MLPELTVNRHFMSEFIAEEAPCLALGMIEERESRCALLALRLDRAIPRAVSAAGFAFGHSLLGGEGWEVVHFGFEFYGFATYHVLINPSHPAARSVLSVMIETGDYFFFALDSDHSATAFRSEVGRDSLAGLKANMPRIRRSTTTDAQYRLAVSEFRATAGPRSQVELNGNSYGHDRSDRDDLEQGHDRQGILLNWVCRDNAGALDRSEDRLVLKPR